MLYRLVRPMKRKGSRKQHFIQRIPADIKGRAAGQRLHIPVGPETVSLTISPSAATIRLSLRTSEPATVKQRQAQVASYLESVWQALRADQPVPLDQGQAVALAAELYASWADPRRARDTGPIVFNRQTGEWEEDADQTELGQWEAVAAI